MEQCVLAEKVGFSSFFFGEHHGTDTGRIPTPEIMCGALALLTERIRLGTDIIPLPLHHPLRIAEAASVVDIMSNGRFILGLGLGYKKEEFDAFGIPLSERRGRFEEGVRIIRKLFTEEQVTFDGRFFKLTRFPLMPKPVQKDGPPIWIGALARPAVLRAARLGDAWIPSPVMPEGVEFYSDCLVVTRAIENRVNYVAVNRVGTENGLTFFGKSKIISYDGRVLAEAGTGTEEIIYADLDLRAAQNKKAVRVPGEWEINQFEDRRPEFYQPITRRAKAPKHHMQ